MNLEKLKPIWLALQRGAGRAKHGTLVVEARVLRGVRWTGGHTMTLLCRLGPALARVLDLIAPPVTRASIATGRGCRAGYGRFRPRWVHFWIWITPVRLAIAAGLAWLLNKVCQFGDLTEKEAFVMRGAIGSDEKDALWRTRTRVDVGMWYRKGRVWVCPLAEELLLFAEGPRPWIERIAYSDIRESRYNHVTAEIALAPEPDLPLSTLRVRPLEALALMRHFRRVGSHS